MRTLFVLVLVLASAGCAQVNSPRQAWVADHGGIYAGAAAHTRAQAALERVRVGPRLSVQVLSSPDCAAFSFNDGSIYISLGLMQRLSDDELAAVISHEIGHLLHNGVVPTPQALTGTFAGLDIETEADLRGRALLVARDVPASALTSALEKVADASQGTPYCEGLRLRVAHLRKLDASSPRPL